MADNPRAKSEYDLASQRTAVINELGQRVEFAYNLNGQVTTVRNALGQETHFAYNAGGQQISLTDALGHVTQTEYNDANQVTRVTFADGSSQLKVYDAQGRVVEEIDEAGVSTHFEHDSFGRLTAVVDALGQRTTYEYDQRGNLIRRVDANQHATVYEYDHLGRETALVLPQGQRSEKFYTQLGPIDRVVGFDGQTTQFEYNTMQQLTRATYADGTVIRYTYTATGLRETVTDPTGTTRYTYDARDRLLSRATPDGRTIQYGYDLAGRLTSVTTPGGTTTYEYDAAGRMIRSTDTDAGLVEYAYDAAGNLTKVTMPGNLVENREYDTRNRVVLLEHVSTSGPIDRYEYTLDPTGRIAEVDELSGRHIEYDYDALYRLTGEIINDTLAGNRTITYTYDPVGNRLTRTDSLEGLTSYTYDANDQLRTAVQGASITSSTYDLNGNLISRVVDGGESVQYAWNSKGELIRVTATNGATVHDSRFVNDADGNRIEQNVDGVVTKLLVNAAGLSHVAEEYAANGDLLARNIRAGGNMLRVDAAGVHLNLADLHSGVRQIVTPAGVLEQTTVYDAFGRVLIQSGLLESPYQYRSEVRDSLTGLDYLRARYYESETGRFLSRDPLAGQITNPLTQNSYLYVIADPVNRVDPTGEESKSLAELAGTYGVKATLFGGVTFSIGYAIARCNGEESPVIAGLKTAAGSLLAAVGLYVGGALAGLSAGGLAIVGGVAPAGATAEFLGATASIGAQGLSILGGLFFAGTAAQHGASTLMRGGTEKENCIAVVEVMSGVLGLRLVANQVMVSSFSLPKPKLELPHSGPAPTHTESGLPFEVEASFMQPRQLEMPPDLFEAGGRPVMRLRASNYPPGQIRGYDGYSTTIGYPSGPDVPLEISSEYSGFLYLEVDWGNGLADVPYYWSVLNGAISRPLRVGGLPPDAPIPPHHP